MLDLVQGTPEWLAARCGSLGASSMGDALARTKTGWGASRANLKARLVTERITGQPVEMFVNAAMQRGTDLEPQARAMYSLHTGHDVAEVGIVLHPSIPHTHCSPDGLIADDGMVEIKCCGAARHIELLTDSLPEDRYVKQCLWQMACTGRQWVDLAYFHPDLPSAMQLVIHRIERDDAVIAEMEKGVADFLAEVAATVAELEARYMTKEAA
jgi:putative phage-type endonuclease